MALREAGRIGKRGTLVIPAKLRRLLGLVEGAEVIVEQTSEGILVRPALTVPFEIYAPERRAEFLLSNAVDVDDYRQAVALVREMGLDPATIAHHRPEEA